MRKPGASLSSVRARSSGFRSKIGLISVLRAYRIKKRAERQSPHIAVCPHPWRYALNFRRELRCHAFAAV